MIMEPRVEALMGNIKREKRKRDAGLVEEETIPDWDPPIDVKRVRRRKRQSDSEQSVYLEQ